MVDGLGTTAVKSHLADRGIDADVHTVRLDDRRALRLVRADLMETTFATPVPVGV